MKRFFAVTATLALWFNLSLPITLQASPVLLTFDVESPEDQAALKTLDIAVPATYFVTGEFAESHKELVATLSKSGNTIGSHSYNHPHFRAIDSAAVTDNLSASKKILESITGKPVVWFRAPYLEYDERTLRALKILGFEGDSSDKDAWSNQAVIHELPISGLDADSLIASDYDMLDEYHFSKGKFESTLKKLYRQKASSGQPLVILIHPRVSAKYPDALNSFVRFVRNSHGEFFSIDGYHEALQHRRPHRFAVWADLSHGADDPESLATGLAAAGVTDVFIRVQEGIADDSKELFGRTVSVLKSKGLKVHLWISPLAGYNSLKLHPEWAMTAKDGSRSAEWMSPVNPEVSSYAAESVKALIRKYRPDGVCLDNLAYPDLEYDYSQQMLKAFASSYHIDHTPVLSELMNRYYTEWCIWRSQVISDFAGKIGNTVSHEGRGAVEFSGTIPGSSALNYREPESSGQNFAMFDRDFDFLVPVVKLSGREDEIDQLRLMLFALSVQAGKRPIMLRVSEATSGGPLSSASLAVEYGELSIGADGIGLLPGTPLYIKDGGREKINPQTLDRLKQLSTDPVCR
jgi:peptidoglycan/xylan/chitin deacetylase (PgdA/CDA1 family)